MADTPLDRIHIRDLRVRCIIGIYPQERTKMQEVVINLTIHADLSRATESDDVNDTIDYKAIKEAVLAFVESSSCYLIEHLAQRIVETVFEHPSVAAVDVTVDKPGALRFARSVAVQIYRARGGQDA